MEDAWDEVEKDGASLKVTTSNDTQLPTPALSPITEHAGGVTNDGQEPSPNGQNGILDDNLDGALDSPFLPKIPQTPQTKSEVRPEEQDGVDQKTLKASPAQIFQLTSSPGSIPWRTASPIAEEIPLLSDTNAPLAGQPTQHAQHTASMPGLGISNPPLSSKHGNVSDTNLALPHVPLPSLRGTPGAVDRPRPATASRSISSPMIRRKQSTIAPRNPINPIDTGDQSRSRRPTSASLKLGDQSDHPTTAHRPFPPPDPINPSVPSVPSVLPLPPLSLPTYLHLELSSDRPSALYIHRSATSDTPYESSKVKFDRLLNFLLLPLDLEQILCFGALACLDAWLYTFTILPLRFCKAVIVWLQWGAKVIITEVTHLYSFIYGGLGRLWQRKRQPSMTASRNSSVSDPPPLHTPTLDVAASPRQDWRGDEAVRPLHRPSRKERRTSTVYRHRRTKSTPSALLPNHKADILQGLLIIFTCMILLRFDASRIYHNIRGQSAIKLYVIYNSLEVFDRLFSAIGQDVLECLFSKETLERKPNGRSKVLRPMWMFLLALGYNVLHAAALFYQVITLNVAVNSYSNALLTLLMSNQFVEIKGSVFKKLEKENLFQMTCADVVERFQLWLMLLIIALRNIVEVGGLTMNVFGSPAPSPNFNATGPSTQSMGILPQAFTLIPKWSGQVLGPFLIVLGSEMLVDWLKHSYICKFNSVKRGVYTRFLDVLAKDYYSNAFVDQNLMKRLGLPVLPLACLFIRASVQTYHMFVATNMPLPIASTATALAVESASAETSPATTAALAHIDHIFRRALGRSSFGGAGAGATSTFSWWSLDDVIAFATMLVFFLVLYLFLLAFKLVLGMCLLNYARSRYRGMREREKQSYDAGAKRIGGLGAVEIDDEKRRWIYEDDEEGLNKIRARDAKAKERSGKDELKLDGIERYMMAAKRIW